MSTNSQFTVMVHVLTMLRAAPDPLSSTVIADSVNANPVTIRKVIGKLRDAGWVATIPGANGGAVLRRDAAKISLGDVYLLVREESLFGMHINTPNPNCPVGSNIQDVLADVYTETDHRVIESLSAISIQDVWERILAKI